MFHGTIYGYRDPATGKMRYVGQTINLTKRHRVHLRASSKLSVDKWLHSMQKPPEPELLCEVIGKEHQAFLDDMAYQETVAMFQHHTYLASYPKEGGFNRVIPQSKDYLKLGLLYGYLGGKVSGPKNAKSGYMAKLGHTQGIKNIENGHMERMRAKSDLSAAGRLGGHVNALSGHAARMGLVQGRKNVESGHWDRVRLLGMKHASANGRIQGRKNAENGHISRISALGRTPENQSKGRHVRWHVNRGINNPACSFCGEV